MSKTRYSDDDYKARADYKASTGKATFTHHDDIRTGKATGVHPTLSPRGVKIRESRDSDLFPRAIPVALCNDLTGSMGNVPIVLQAQEPKLMGLFLKDRADGKRYLGDVSPAIMIAGVDDWHAMGAEGSLQVGQFEHGIEIDDNLTNLWLTGRGGNNWGESYDLFLYFLARHTAHDHYDKRGLKGHAFVMCDEPLFENVSALAVEQVIGDKLQADIPIGQIIAEVQERYWLNVIIPKQTSHYESPDLRSRWERAVGAQHVLYLDDPTKICELLVSCVAMCEGMVSLDELVDDKVADAAVSKALVPLSKSTGGAVSRFSAAGLPAVAGSGGSERL